MVALLPWTVANTVALLLLAAIFAHLHTAIGRPALGWWAAGFSLGAVGQLISGLDLIYGPVPLAALCAGAFASLTGAAYLQANYIFLGRRVPKPWWVAWAVAAVWVPIALGLGHAGAVPIVPLFIMVAASLTVAGSLVVRDAPDRVSGWMAGGGQVLLGLHILDFPVVSLYPALQPWGYLVAIALNVLVGIGLIMRHFEDAREELLQASRQLSEARRVEAIGRLAGGVAHDFNNLLTVILTGVEFAELKDCSEDERQELLGNIRGAAERAARLTAQLLALGRRSVLRPEPFDLAQALDELVGMLRRVTPENIDLQLHNVEGPLTVLLDRTGVEQLILNLVANARDAMPEGGTLDVRLTVHEAPAPAVCLRVTDTGVGMDEETVARVFEPFFTTKSLGQGTGLGLATVQGVVAQMGGQISLDSTPGHGTTVDVRLPAPSGSQVRRDTPRAETLTAARILVVEDEDEVRRVAERILGGAGHEVQGAADGAIALARLEDGSSFDLVVSDVVMPNLGGVELAHRIAELAPQTAVLLISGHPMTDSFGHSIPAGVGFLNKPYTRQQLLDAVERALPNPQRQVG